MYEPDVTSVRGGWPLGRLLGSGLAAHNDRSSVTMVMAALVVGTFVLGCLCLTISLLRLSNKVKWSAVYTVSS